MREARLIRLTMAGALALSFAVTFGGCSSEKPMVVGGGAHLVTGIYIRAQSPESPGNQKAPVTLTVGERLQLRCLAGWAIPSVTDVTGQTAWTVSDPTVGAVNKGGVFTALKAGKAVVMALVRVSRTNEDEVLDAGQAPTSGSLKTFGDALQVVVVAPSDATAAPSAAK